MKKIALLACLFAATSSVYASSMDTQQVEALVKQKMHLEPVSVKKVPMGLYEVVVERSVLYVDKNVNFVTNGHFFEIATKEDITQERLDELAMINPKELPLNQAIKTVKGNGKRVLYVFSDPYCSYCKRLEQTIGTLTDITVYTFVTPLLKSDEMVNRIFCSPDPKKAWHDWMINNVEPKDKEGKCQNTTGDKNINLASELGIENVPTIFFADGYRMKGAVSKEYIELKLSSLK